jgi:hypothetical protein
LRCACRNRSTKFKAVPSTERIDETGATFNPTKVVLFKLANPRLDAASECAAHAVVPSR